MVYHVHKPHIARILTHCLLVILSVISSSQLHAQQIRWFQPRNPLQGEPRAMSVQDDFVYVLSSTVLSRSHLNGGGWRELSTVITTDRLRSFLVRGQFLLLGTDDGLVYRSSDFGANWMKVNYSFVGPVTQLCRWRSSIVALSGDRTCAIADSSALAWSTVASPPFTVRAMHSDEQSLHIVTDSSIYRLEPQDSTWKMLCATPAELKHANGVFVDRDTIVISGSNGLWRSFDAGLSWIKRTDVGVDASQMTRLYVQESLLCCVSGEGSDDHPASVFRSNDRGATWYAVTRFRGNAVRALAYKNEVVVEDSKRHIIDVKPIISDALDLCAVPVPGSIRVLAAHDIATFVVCDNEPLRELRGKDIWLPVTLPPVVVRDAVYLGDRLVTMGEGSIVSYSDDGGLSWFPSGAEGLPDDAQWRHIDESQSVLYALSVDSLLFRSVDGGKQWLRLNSTSKISAFCLQDSVCLAWCTSVPPALMRVSRTDTLGAFLAQTFSNVRCMSTTPSNAIVIALGDGATLQRSLNDGHTWGDCLSSGIQGKVSSLQSVAGYLVAVTDSNGVFLSSDDGDHWTQENLGLTDLNIVHCKHTEKSIFLGTRNDGLFYGTIGILASVEHINSDDRGGKDAELHDHSLDNSYSRAIALHPTPSSDYLRIYGCAIGGVIEIYTLNGELVYTCTSAMSVDVNTSEFSAGVYTLLYRHSDIVIRRPVLVVH